MGGGDASCSPMIRSQSFGKPVALDCELHQCFSEFFLPSVEKDDKKGLDCVLPFPPWKSRVGWSRLGSGKRVLLRTGLVRTEYSGVFQNASFSPPYAGSTRGFFSSIHYENLIELLVVKLTKVWRPLCDWVSLELLFLGLVYTEPPAICQLQFRISYPVICSHGGFCSRML